MHWDPSITQRSHRSRWVSYLRWQFGENKKVAKQGNIQTTFHHPLLSHLLPELKDEENSSQTVGEFQSSPVSSIFCKWVVVLKKKKKRKCLYSNVCVQSTGMWSLSKFPSVSSLPVKSSVETSLTFLSFSTS